MKLQIYIENEIVDLHEDENIILNSSVQNVKDISKIFTDYSQAINAPASKQNNKIFKHFYDSEITNGYDYRTRKDAFMEIDTLPFKVGKVQLEGVTVENNKPVNYRFRFYGSLVKLTDLFGEDELNDLDLSAYNHDYNASSVAAGFGSTLLSGNVIYPLISPVRNWLWDSNDIDDIEYVSATLPSTTNGIAWSELKPAIKIARLIEAIETDYGITFSADFFGTADFEKLFMWVSKEKGYLNAFGEPLIISIGGNTTFNLEADSDGATVGTMVDELELKIVPVAGFESVEYSIIIDDGTEENSYEKVGTSYAKYTVFYMGGTVSKTISFYIQSATNFQYTGTLTRYETNFNGTIIVDVTTVIGSTATESTAGKVYMSNQVVSGIYNDGQMPEFRIQSFFESLIKQNNLVIVPTDTLNDFYVDTLDNWYSLGATHDITKYINKGSYPINAPPIHNRITFKYKETETILGERYRETNNSVGYGDLTAEFDNDGKPMTIPLLFENILLERLSSQVTGVYSDIHVGKIIDDNYDEVKTNPFIFYNRGITTITGNGFAFINDAGGRIQVTSYNNVGQENELEHGSITQTLNFGAEISSWTLQLNENSLYANRYQDYITDLFSKQRRIFNYKAILPDWLIAKIKLNDKLIIEDRRYVINEMKTNLITNEVDFELLNDIY